MQVDEKELALLYEMCLQRRKRKAFEWQESKETYYESNIDKIIDRKVVNLRFQKWKQRVHHMNKTY
jgi:hypothetical protein